MSARSATRNGSSARPKAPSHLRAATRRWYEQVVTDYVLDDHHLHVLRLACEALDRAEQARAKLRRHGLTYDDRWGVPHARPEVQIERDSRAAFARLLRELDLDAEPPSRTRAPRRY
jgi:P27 family predicted phage terminase small subunit